MSTEITGAKRIYRIDLGMKVILDLISIDGADRMEVEIVEDRFADIRLGFLGISTPLAKAILGHSAGDLVPFLVEGTDDVRIIEVFPSGKALPHDVADRRQETIRKAIDQSDRTNAVIFASSFSGKWGDYDPSSFLDNGSSDQENEEEDPPSITQ
jgi:hypothetical protein